MREKFKKCLLSTLTLSILVSAVAQANLECKAGKAMVPGYQTALTPVGTNGKWILMKMVAASGRNPEGFAFYDCEDGKLSDQCPNLLAEGIVIPTKDLLSGTTGRWSTFEAYAKVFGVIGVLIGANSATPTAFGVSGLSGLIPLSALDQFKRASFAHNVIVGAFRHACAHKILVDKKSSSERADRIGSEPVLRNFDDMKTDVVLMLTNIMSHIRVDRDAKPGSEAYAIDMSINDYVNEAYQKTRAEEAKCAADPTKCPADAGKSKDK